MSWAKVGDKIRILTDGANGTQLKRNDIVQVIEVISDFIVKININTYLLHKAYLGMGFELAPDKLEIFEKPPREIHQTQNMPIDLDHEDYPDCYAVRMRGQI